MFRKKVYQWHRRLSILMALPLLLWSISGLLHPIMTNIKPNIAAQTIQPIAIDSSKIKLDLQQVLQLHKIDSITYSRMVHIDSNWFYQVQSGVNSVPIYLSATNGKILRKGDWLYAQWLARQFLEGGQYKTKKYNSGNADPYIQDCCDAAAICVLKNSKGGSVTSAVMLTNFNSTYKSVNKILPVWEVAFERKDSIRIYVETTQDRFVLGVDRNRVLFNHWFAILHTWGWIDFLGNAKWVVEITCCLLILFTVYFGLYIFFTSNYKRGQGTGIQRNRKWHRLSGIAFSLFTIAFTLSGAIHCVIKFFPDNRAAFVDQHWFYTRDLPFSWTSIRTANGDQPANLSPVHIGGIDYWRVTDIVKPDSGKKGSMHDVTSTIRYFAFSNLQLLKDGDIRYARWLASKFSGQPVNAVVQTAVLNKFSGAYGFANKRLPVIKVQFGGRDAAQYYVETATGRLAAKLNLLDQIEGYSFAFLHKHEFLVPLGKTYKDISTVFWAGAQILLVLLGLMLFVRVKSRKRRSRSAV